MDRWERQREAWARWASDYDARTAGLERRYLAATRPWVCGRARGETLEVAAGTGTNLAHYPGDVTLTITERDPDMLAQVRAKASGLGRAATFAEADALALPFADASFDAVVCTYALCGVETVEGALAEMLRVLRPGGSLLLADHVLASAWPVRVLQRGLDLVTGPGQGEYWTRRPLLTLQEMGVSIAESRRQHFGVLECVHALR